MASSGFPSTLFAMASLKSGSPLLAGGEGGAVEVGVSSEHPESASKVDPRVAIRKHIFPKRMYCFFHWNGKRQAMVFILIHSFAIIGLPLEVFSQESDLLKTVVEKKVSLVDNRPSSVFRAKTGQSVDSYRAALEKLVSFSEKKGGFELSPSVIRKIGIKIETSCAPGLQVSTSLVDALLLLLKKRGYHENQVFLADQDLQDLKMAGFAKGASDNRTYRGHRLFCSVDKEFFDSDWFHDSPMPPTIHDRARFFLRFPTNREKRIEEERKSYLPALLFLGDVYWINLAVAMDSVNMGINGASTNLSLGAIDNYQRFLNKPVLGPAATTEILAIPEIWQKRAFSILDLSKFQFAAGQSFDAEFVGRDPVLLLGENPISVDYFGLQVLTLAREKRGMKARKPEDVLIFRYAKELGLGDVKDAKLFDLP
jgi:hypothetical protein